MKIWILEPVENLPKNDDPWKPWYDKAYGFVVRAESEEEARKMASKDSGDEKNETWLDQKYTTCLELTVEGEAGIVMVKYAPG